MYGRLLGTLTALTLASCNLPQPATLGPQIPADQRAFLATCKAWDEWDKPAPPYRIYGNSYYVGTCGISAILVAGDAGHILIDGASLGGGPLIEASIQQLGFEIEDVEFLLHSHEHFDHVGGLAYLKEMSGAKMVASPGAAQALRTGETQSDDPQFGMHPPFDRVEVDQLISDSDVVSLGRLALIAMDTPGHTPGALSWSWWSCYRTDCKLLVYMDSLSPISRDDYKFSDHSQYLAQFRNVLERLHEMPCDIALTPHPSASSMLKRMASGGGLIGTDECARYAEAIGARLEKRLAEEADAE